MNTSPTSSQPAEPLSPGDARVTAPSDERLAELVTAAFGAPVDEHGERSLRGFVHQVSTRASSPRTPAEFAKSVQMGSTHLLMNGEHFGNARAIKDAELWGLAKRIAREATVEPATEETERALLDAVEQAVTEGSVDRVVVRSGHGSLER